MNVVQWRLMFVNPRYSHVIILDPRILKWFVYFKKTCALLLQDVAVI